MTNDDVLARHLAHCRQRRLRPATVNVRRRVLRKIGADLATPWTAVTEDQLADWQAGLRVQPWSVCTYTMHVRSLCTWMQAAHLREDNPAATLLRPRMPKSLPHPMAEDDLGLALACADEPVRTWILLGAYAGLRCMEIAHLTRADITADRGIALLTVRDGKGGRDRIVPIGQNLHAALRQHMAGPGPLFRTTDGRQLTAAHLSITGNRYLRSLGFTDRMHSLRHRYGTRLYQLSHDLRMVGDVLGHSDPATTSIYTAWSPAHASASIAELDSGIAA